MSGSAAGIGAGSRTSTDSGEAMGAADAERDTREEFRNCGTGSKVTDSQQAKAKTVKVLEYMKATCCVVRGRTIRLI